MFLSEVRVRGWIKWPVRVREKEAKGWWWGKGVRFIRGDWSRLWTEHTNRHTPLCAPPPSPGHVAGYPQQLTHWKLPLHFILNIFRLNSHIFTLWKLSTSFYLTRMETIYSITCLYIKKSRKPILFYFIYFTVAYVLG